uniref:Secreted protein n=1 Tax=Anguilla anguilla TaxID=7936 RepID=A0A0E9X004_ANGAN
MSTFGFSQTLLCAHLLHSLAFCTITEFGNMHKILRASNCNLQGTYSTQPSPAKTNCEHFQRLSSHLLFVSH